MFKSLKDAKRRVVETMLEAVKVSEKTVDEEFDLHHAKFNVMMGDLNECGAGLHSLLAQQKNFFHDANEVAANHNRLHSQYVDREFWPGTTTHLTTIRGSEVYKEKMELIHNVYRSSTALINLEQALEPLRETIAKIGPEIEAITKERNTIVIDLDSYRRRLKAAREKKETLEKQGKGNTSAYTDNENEIAKFEAKERATKENYEKKNREAKDQIIEAKAMHDHVVSEAFITTVVCQYELYSRAAKELSDVMALLPQDKVRSVKEDIDELIKKGGIKQEKDEKTKLQKGLAIFTGKALPSDFKKEEQDVAAPSAPPAAPAAPVPAPTAVLSNKSSNPFGEDDKPPAPRTGPLPPPPPGPPSGKKKVLVKALYDHVAEADDELSFNVGELIEVLATSDDGWWKGKCNGREGLFPVNYVDSNGI